MRVARRVPVLSIGGLVLACTATADAPPGDESMASHATARDSAGITVIETPDLSGIDTLAWSVDSLPELVIGVTDGEAPYLFSSIAGVARMGDGRIVVADALSDDVRFYDAQGRFLHAVGGRGEGPTEYRDLVLLDRIAGDSLVVVDGEPPRVTVLTPAGQLVRRFRGMLRDSTGERASGMLMHAFADGTLLSQESLGSNMTPDGVLEMSLQLLRASQDGERSATYVGSEHTLAFTNPSITRRDRPEPDPPRWVAGPVHLFFTRDPDGLDFTRFAASGTIDRVFRVPGYVRPRPAQDEEDSAASLAMAEDATGHFWVRLDPVSTDAGPTDAARWVVFDPAGEARYGLRLPGPVSNRRSYGPTMEIGDDYVLIATRNASDAPIVAMYRLRKR